MDSLDRDILRNAQQGDRASFALLVESYYPRAFRDADARRAREDAEEAVQDAFIRVHDNLARFRADAPFDPWFFRILGNRCRTLAEKRKRHHQMMEYSDVIPDVRTRTPTVLHPTTSLRAMSIACWPNCRPINARPFCSST